MKVLVITSCTGKKKSKPRHQLTKADFALKGRDAFSLREKELAAHMLPAEELYTGQQHVRLMKGVRAFRERFGGDALDLWILSAGYGLIPGTLPIAPYECTFQGLRVKELKDWSAFLHVPNDIQALLSTRYDLALFLLGDSYLRACQLNGDTRPGGSILAFCGEATASKMPSIPDIHPIVLTKEHAKQFSAGFVSLKGEVARRVLETLSQKPDALCAFVQNDPSILPRLLEIQREEPLRPKRKRPSAPSPDAIVPFPPISIPKDWYARPHRQKMLYFIPEWDDLVNPQYNFLTDTAPEGTGDGYQTAVYAHQIYPEPQYDGILISKVVVEKKKSKRAILEKLGVHQYLRVPRDFPIMGDCGAFGYIDEIEPPYETDEILDYYQRLDFDYGVSIDHLIVNGVLTKTAYFMANLDGQEQEISQEEYERLKASGEAREVKKSSKQLSWMDARPLLWQKDVIDEAEKHRRYALTMENARQFIERHRKKKYTFMPIGAAQGWSPESYADAVKAYQEMGYEMVALGGLVRTNTTGILEVLEAINKVLKPGVRLHLFGVARPDALAEMQRLGVRSIDSASFLRRAWLGASSNYFTLYGSYAAIRVPQTGGSFRAKRIVQQGLASLEELRALEKQCLSLLRDYERRLVGAEAVLDAVMTYDDYMGGNRKGFRELFLKTLEDRPWEQCGCEICRNLGIEVMIFRGNNRNRRRGFHNTKVFYEHLCRTFGGA